MDAIQQEHRIVQPYQIAAGCQFKINLRPHCTLSAVVLGTRKVRVLVKQSNGDSITMESGERRIFSESIAIEFSKTTNDDFKSGLRFIASMLFTLNN
ncbi:unnamed protein product [Calicophoron daubneyi]|uniref:Uncharacterized protein n=1 Tax=Calicophoron daubneyi TaxID=300641 RepID=A0AAV2TX38_CALDB